MPQRTTRRRIATIDYAANQVVRTELPISGKVRRLFLELSGTLDVTGAGGTVVARNPGTLIPSLSIFLDREELLKQGRWLDWRDRMYMHNKLPAEVPDTAAVNATAIASRIQIPFLTPVSARPVDTVLDMDAHQRLDIEVQWGDENSILSGGTKSFVAGNGVAPTIDVIAEISRFDPAPIATYKELAFDSGALLAVANPNLELELVTGARKAYHHILLVAEDNPGVAGRTLAATALNEIRIQQQGAGEISDPFGRISGVQQQNDFDTLFRTVDGVQVGLYPIPFQGEFDGRKTFNLDSAGLDDLRILIDHAAFATAGTIRVVHGLVEDLF